MREIKYRGKRIDNGKWVYGDGIACVGNDYCAIPQTKNVTSEDYQMTLCKVELETVGEYTGHKIKEVDLYEGDIVRVEENGDGVDPSDKMTYYVVVWLKEWTMFSLLRVSDEYQDYINGSVDDLDTSMFWTFPLDVEDIGSSQHFLCGNIFDNKELLT